MEPEHKDKVYSNAEILLRGQQRNLCGIERGWQDAGVRRDRSAGWQNFCKMSSSVPRLIDRSRV
jgi:hypothetical protein